MPLPTVGDLGWLPALEHPELLAPGTYSALVGWATVDPRVSREVAVAAIDPALADTAALTAAHRLPVEVSVNCVVVAGKRDGVERVAAAAIRADTRADVNNVIKRILDVRKASFMALESAVAGSGMEYGGITPIGLPVSWRVLIDLGAATRGLALIGSGIRGAKLLLPGDLLAGYPGSEVIEGLAFAPVPTH